MLVTQPLEAFQRKLVVRALGLLQTDDIRPHALDELCHQIDAQTNRVDVPGSNGEGHGLLVGRKVRCPVHAGQLAKLDCPLSRARTLTYRFENASAKIAEQNWSVPVLRII